VSGIWIHFSGVGFDEAQDVSGKFDDHALHTQTNAKGGQIVFPAIFQCSKLPFNATIAKAGGDDKAVHALEFGGYVTLVERL